MKIRNNIADKWVLWASLFLYCVLLTFTIYFYQERLCIDSSYYFFKSLNKEFFHIEHQRLVLLIAEIPVVLGNIFNLPLKYIVLLFSVWHALFFFLIGIYCSKKYNKPEYLLLFLSLQTIGILYSFVNPIFELYYGIAILSFMFILLKEEKQLSLWQKLILAICGLFIVSSHPFNIVLFFGILLLDFLSRKKWGIIIGAIALTAIVLFVKSYYISGYEQGKISWILNFKHNKSYLNLIDKDYLLQHGKLLRQFYKSFIILLFVFLIWGYRTIPFKRYLIIVIGIICSAILAHLSFALNSYSGYIEQVLFIVVAIVLTGIFIELVPNIKSSAQRNFLFALLLICCSYRMYMQYNLGKKFTTRIDWINNKITELDDQKLCKGLYPIQGDEALLDYLGWDIPYTSMVYSSIKNEQTKSIAPMHLADSSFFYSIKPSQYYFRLDEVEEQEELNPKYFKFCDQSAYRILRPIE